MSEWMAWCLQTASCYWWPFETAREWLIAMWCMIATGLLLTAAWGKR